VSELQRLQQLFWDAARNETAPPEVAVDFVSRGALSAEARLGIYRTAYWVRQVSALRELFPRVVALLGDGPFARAASRYVGRHPSTSWALEHLGAGFPAWLAQTERAPLGAVAAVEWVRFSTFIAPDAPAVGRDAIDPSTFADARLTVGPHVATAPVTPEVLEQLELTSLGDATARPVLAVWRSGFGVLQRLVTRGEADALAAAQAGAPLAVVCEHLACDVSEPEALFEVLSAWFERGWVTALAAAH
jgi:hypothetical protein